MKYLGEKKFRKGKNEIIILVFIFMELFYNEDEFDVYFLKDEKRVKRCVVCGIEFLKLVII